MGFGNIGLLVGMLLGVVPIIIHLINRRRAKLRRFAAIEFLLMSDKRLARRLKLKQLLVLALRVALILALAFALAKPYLEPDTAPGREVSEPGAIAILIDDSASMQATDESGDRAIDRALAEARSLIDAGGPRTSFAIVAMGAPARLLTPGLTYDHQVATRALAKIESAGPSGRGADLEGAMSEAGRILSESGERERRIHVLSDMAAHAWKPLSSGWTWVPVTSFDVRHDGDKSEDEAATVTANLATMDVRVGDPGAANAAGDQTLEVTAQVANFGATETSATVEMKLGSTVAAEVVTVPPGGMREVPFKVTWSPGVSQGVVTVASSPNNRLDQDDAYYFVVGARRSVQALVVNGSPRSTDWLDELFFLRAALASTAPGETPIDARVVQTSELTTARVDAADVVVLANVGTLTKEQTLLLEQFTERGGGVFIAAGDQWASGDATAEQGDGQPSGPSAGQPNGPSAGGPGQPGSGQIGQVNASYGRLLPFPVREVKSVGKPGDPRAVLSSLGIASVDFTHPIFKIFDGLEDASLFKAHVLSHVLVDTAGRPDAKVLASFTGGIPALVEAPLGRGRVVLLTTTVDRDWADLALRTSFPPLMQRICAYLARTLERPGGPGIAVGEEAHVQVPDGRGPLVLVRPDGGEAPVEAADDAPTVFIGAPDTAGPLPRHAGRRARAGAAVRGQRRPARERSARRGRGRDGRPREPGDARQRGPAVGRCGRGRGPAGRGGGPTRAHRAVAVDPGGLVPAVRQRGVVARQGHLTFWRPRRGGRRFADENAAMGGCGPVARR